MSQMGPKAVDKTQPWQLMLEVLVYLLTGGQHWPGSRMVVVQGCSRPCAETAAAQRATRGTSLSAKAIGSQYVDVEASECQNIKWCWL